MSVVLFDLQQKENIKCGRESMGGSIPGILVGIFNFGHKWILKIVFSRRGRERERPRFKRRGMEYSGLSNSGKN